MEREFEMSMAVAPLIRRRRLKLFGFNARASCGQLARLLLSTDITQFAALERFVKTLLPYQKESVYPPRDVAAWTDGWAGVVALSWHPNGYVRELDISEFETLPAHFVLPLLLMRSVDWVTEVRSLAETKVAGSLPGLSDEHIVNSMPVLLYLLERQNVRKTEVVDLVIHRLAKIDPFMLAHYIHRLQDRERKQAFQLVIREPSLQSSDLIQISVVDSDAGTKSIGATLVARTQKPLPLKLLLELSEGDDAHLRQASLVGICRDWPEEAPVVVRKLQWDQTLAVLTTCHFFLRKLGLLNLREQRLALNASSSKLLVPALLVLGLSGSISDGTYCVSFLAHAVARVRWAALVALGLLHTPVDVPRVIGMLHDSNWKVRKQAERLLASTDLSPYLR